MNNTPSATVASSHQHSFLRSFFFSAQCARVTVPPLETRMMVLMNGIPNAGMISNTPPMSPGPFVGHAPSNPGHSHGPVANPPAPSPASHGTE